MDINTITKLYKLEDEENIIKFIESNNYLIDFLIDFYKQAKKIFENSIIHLSLVDDHTEILFASIYTNLSVDEAMSKMEYIDENWFICNMDKARGKFNYDVEWENKNQDNVK